MAKKRFIPIVLVSGIALLFGCGQKGPLFLAPEKPIVQKNQTHEKTTSEQELPGSPQQNNQDNQSNTNNQSSQTTALGNPIGKANDTLTTPVIIELDTLTINGTLTRLQMSTAKAWETMLLDPALQQTQEPASISDEIPASTLRYIVFMGDILAPQLSQDDMLVGQVEKRPNLTSTTTIEAGTYLRFRQTTTDYRNIPEILSAARQYFAANPTIIRIKNSDFIIENNEQIDLYIQVENKRQ